MFDPHGLHFGTERDAIDHRKSEHGAGRDALLTPRADWRVYMQSGLMQRDRTGRTKRHAQAARIAAILIDDSNTERDDSDHRARRYGYA